MNDDRYQILVAVDGSDTDERALDWALDEAKLRKAEVTALFTWQTPLIGVPGAFDRKELEQRAKDLLAATVGAASSVDGVTVKQMIAEGDPADSLLGACEQAGADLLVLGTRGAGMLSGALGATVAAKAPCPVLLVRSSDAVSAGQ